MSHRPLAIVSGLTIGDYLLWNWSLNANHDVLALVSGLTLPPLAIACVWLLALAAARVLARTGRGRSRTRPATAARAQRHRRVVAERTPGTGDLGQASTPASPSPASSRPSRKIAA